MGSFGRRGALVGAAGVAAGMLLPARAGAENTVWLPTPRGGHAVGAVTTRLVDRGRVDPWGSGPRELMVTAHYPSAWSAGCARLPYMLPRAAAHFGAVSASRYLGLDLPWVAWDRVVSNARVGAPAAAGGPRAVVLYSPGLGEPRTWGTVFAEELASRGFVVVSIDHTHESPEVEFPDGRLVTLEVPSDPDAFVRKALAVRVADVQFVVDSLANWLPRDVRVDLNRVGMFGASMGGSAAAVAMASDARIRAGVNLDGNLTYPDGSLLPVAESGLDRPFLLIGKDGPTNTGPGWQAFRASTPGWNRHLTLLGAEHASFTDAQALLPQLNLPADRLTSYLGTLRPAEALRTRHAYTIAFFDHALRGHPTTLFDGPSPAYPAMGFA
ncbi:alpha/beta hydrolase family protein [Actinokineospora globicatena]|uniref:alpha/beta hydrolase family protein n=1 Tax=Actinokineospora globicatena TaxID=103729 RepID=UPI0020A3CC39|nr:Tat pathway signal protein [Actinokineospora globicatena]